MPIVSSADAHKLTSDIFQACGSPPEEANIVADHLVNANLCGVDSHGVIRIPQYVHDVQAGDVKPGAAIGIVNETPVSAVVDCGWNFGIVGAERTAEIALNKAQSSRIAIVTSQRCNHAGRLGHYLEKIAQREFIGFGFCSSPKHGHFVVPWGGRDGRLSTNPLAYAIPGDGTPIISDFSTSQAPEGRIRLYKNRKQNLPEGWILNAKGEPSTSTSDFYGPPRGGILPFGGRQGYRGYALGLLVEIMGTVLAGNDSTEDRPGNGITFIVFDPTLLVSADLFEDNLKKLKDYVRSSRPSKRGSEIMLPGEPEQRNRTIRSKEGIEVEEATWSAILQVAATLKVDLRLSG
jgi:hydroxycarboxylate dehydrogenase B